MKMKKLTIIWDILKGLGVAIFAHFSTNQHFWSSKTALAKAALSWPWQLYVAIKAVSKFGIQLITMVHFHPKLYLHKSPFNFCSFCVSFYLHNKFVGFLQNSLMLSSFTFLVSLLFLKVQEMNAEKYIPSLYWSK